MERNIHNWMENIFGSFNTNWLYTMVFWITAILGALSALITHWIMLIQALKFTRGQLTKKIWIIIAFFLPIVDSALYLLVQFAKTLYTIPSKLRK